MSEENKDYICLVNIEGQYSVWCSWKKIPVGWKQVGIQGTKEECKNYIDTVWTDMRPVSLRNKMNKN